MPLAGDNSRATSPPACRHHATPVVALVGNPNCGKSTLWNALTGGAQPVGNWSGVTVEHAAAPSRLGGTDVSLLDLPGVYSLSPGTVDETVTRDWVASGRVDLLVNVLDASSLERNLYLTMQLAELGMPMVVVLNMADLAREQGVEIDPVALERELGCRVVVATAARREGLDSVGAVAAAALRDGAGPAMPAPRAEPLLSAAAQLEAALAPERVTPLPPHWAAARLLEYDEHVEGLVDAALLERRDALCERIEELLGEESDILIADARYERIGAIVAAVQRRRDRLTAGTSERIDRIVLHPRLGIPIFLSVMYLMFLLTITFGSAFIDLFDQLGGALFVHAPATVMHAIGIPEGIVVLLANGLGGGLQSVATFIPPVGIMFLCLRFLEESGYMARAAFVMDRFMRALGLPGKAFVPMIVGFGCNVPAIMGARTLERERDRRLAVALNPFMSCGARLPVYALFAAAFFPSSGQLIVFVLYLTGIAFAVLTGLILKRTLLGGDLTPFVMELPPYHRPALRSVLGGAWTRLRSFLVGAGKLIVPVVAGLTLLSSIGTDGSFGHEDTDASVLSAIGRTITPAFEPMGIEADNWPATVGIFTGIFAKEAVVGTLDALYSQFDRSAGDAGAAPDPGFAEQVTGAFATVPPNLVDAAHSMVDPLGLSVGPVSSTEAAAAAQGVDANTYGQMVSRFDGQLGAFAYLLFVLLYLPCVAATAAIYRETGRNWAIFVGCWTTGLAFLAATICYQLGTFAEHPGSSSAWIIGLLAVFAFVLQRMRAMGGADDEAAPVRAAAVQPPQPLAPAAEPVPMAPVPAPSEVAAHTEATPPAPALQPAAQASTFLPRDFVRRPSITTEPVVFRAPAFVRPDAAPVRPAPARPAPARRAPAARPAPAIARAASRPAAAPTPAPTPTPHRPAARLDARPMPAFTRVRFTPTADGSTDARS